MEEYNTEHQQCNQMDCQKTKLVVLSLKHVGDVMILELHYQFGTLSLQIQLLNSSSSSGSVSLLTWNTEPLGLTHAWLQI